MQNRKQVIGRLAGILGALSIAGAFLLLLAGCAALTGKGGVVGWVQTADEQYLTAQGVPQSWIDAARKYSGMPDVRNAPDPNQILPAPYTWCYPLYDKDGHEVDPASFHWGNVPRIVGTNSVAASVFSGPADPSKTAFDAYLAGAAAIIKAGKASTNSTASMIP